MIPSFALFSFLLLSSLWQSSYLLTAHCFELQRRSGALVLLSKFVQMKQFAECTAIFDA
jgi:hypothetical protein